MEARGEDVGEEKVGKRGCGERGGIINGIHPSAQHVSKWMDIFLLLDNFVMLCLELLQQHGKLPSLLLDQVLHCFLLTACPGQLFNQ